MHEGRLAGIARHDRPKGPVETLDSVRVTTGEGVHGCFRGRLATSKAGHKRQVSLIEGDCWRAALADAHASLDWQHSRRNLLIENLRLPRATGTRVQIGDSLVVEITEECAPCERMEALLPGLRAAMTPDWRGGFLARVERDGEIAVGDSIKIVE